jgi:short-subunit dehydrogenase
MTNLHSALVVGDAIGVGMASARALLQRGISVTLASGDAQSLHAASRELCFHGTVSSLMVDLYDPAAVDRLAAILGRHPHPIRHFVNAVRTDDYAGRHAALSRNLCVLTHAVTLNMQRHAGGSIVDINSADELPASIDFLLSGQAAGYPGPVRHAGVMTDCCSPGT